MKTWLDKLCEPLEHPKYPQIRGYLVKFDDKHNIIGKCAEGEIICQNNIKMINDGQVLITEEQLLELGVPKDLMGYMYEDNDNFIYHPNGGQLRYDIDAISAFILRYNIAEMNDNGFTYAEIIEYLRTTFEDAV